MVAAGDGINVIVSLGYNSLDHGANVEASPALRL